MREDLLPVTLEGKFDRLIEESCELIKAICKLRRFGERPIDGVTGIQYDNIKDVKDEMQDLKHAIQQVEEHLG